MDRLQFTEAFEGLTPRRRQVLKLLLSGMADRDIAEQLHIEASTVRKHIEKICGTFGLKNDLADERRTLRPELIALFSKYMPDMVSIKAQLEEEANNYEKLIANILPTLQTTTPPEADFSLYNREVFILIDRSGSMVRKDGDTGSQTRYEYLAEIVEGHISAILGKYADMVNKTGEKICDRLQVHFFSRAKATPHPIIIKDASEVWKLFVENQPKTKTFIGPTLEYCVKSWLGDRPSNGKGAFFLIYTDGQFDDEERFIDCIASACANISDRKEVKFFVLGLGEEIDREHFLALDFNLYKLMNFNVFVFDLVNEVDDIIELLSRQLNDEPHLAFPHWVRTRHPEFVERVLKEKSDLS